MYRRPKKAKKKKLDNNNDNNNIKKNNFGCQYFWNRHTHTNSSHTTHSNTLHTLHTDNAPLHHSDNTQHKARFNLLHLEHNEYLFDDYAVYFFPIYQPLINTNTNNPNNNNNNTSLTIDNVPITHSFLQSAELKQAGRLKICSRSLIFEPNFDTYLNSLPIIKFPYKSIPSPLSPMSISDYESQESRMDPNSLFAFQCNKIIKLKENDQVEPYIYETIDIENRLWIFSLKYSQRNPFLDFIEQLRLTVHRIETIPNLLSLGIEPSKNHIRLDEKILLKDILNERKLVLQFDSTHLIDFREIFQIEVPIQTARITPLLNLPGCLMLTDARLYFQPAQLNNIGQRVVSYHLKNIKKIQKRRFLLRQIAIEIFFKDYSSILFSFDTTQIRDYIYDKILKQNILKKILRKETNKLKDIIKKWQERKISNFEYLFHLNSLADRSLNDLTQYPVYPWIISDYTSEKLNLKDPNTFRDLSKPIGALNEERLNYFLERFHNMPEEDPSMGLPPPFLYGTHYSTPGYVLFFLVRVAPEYMLCLQNGRFDIPDRMFISIESTWKSCLESHSDLKELIPEFYMSNGEFLLNNDNLPLGVLQNGNLVDDVILPPWAKNNRDFIKKCRKALESDYVSEHLSEWIDLIFGYKQKNEEAIKSNNLFYHLTYEGSIDIENITDDRKRSATEQQISEFGQTPTQLFKSPHPTRNDNIENINNLILTESLEREEAILQELFPPLTPDEVKLNRKKLLKRDRKSTSSPIPSNGTSARDKILASLRSSRISTSSLIDDDDIEIEENNDDNDDDDEKDFNNNNNNNNNDDKKDDDEIKMINNKLNNLLNNDNILIYNSVYNIHQDSINDISISLNSNTFNQNQPYLCSSSNDGTMKISLIDISSNNINIIMKRNFSINNLPLTKCKINNEGTLAIVGSNDNNIYLYSISNARCIKTLNIHENNISSIDLISNYLCTGSDDTTIKLYSIINDDISISPTLELFDHENKIKCVKIEPNNKNFLISGSNDGIIKITNINTSDNILSINIHSNINDIIWYNNSNVDPDNNKNNSFFITDNEGIIYYYHIDGTLIYEYNINNNNIINTLKIYDNILIGGSNNGSIYLWYINKINLDLIYIENNAHDDIINCMELLNRNNKIYLFTGSNDNKIKIWDFNI